MEGWRGFISQEQTGKSMKMSMVFFTVILTQGNGIKCGGTPLGNLGRLVQQL
jgi:hypothetical protein